MLVKLIRSQTRETLTCVSLSNDHFAWF
jgi:hypothetical protein